MFFFGGGYLRKRTCPSVSRLKRRLRHKTKMPGVARQFCFAVREGFEPSVQFPVRQFSKLILSASQAPHHIAVQQDHYHIKPLFSGLQI